MKKREKNRQKSSSDEALTVAEAARALRVSIPTLKELCSRGTLASFRTPGGHLRVSAHAIENFRESGGPSRTNRAPSEVLQNRRERVEELNLEALELRAKRDLAKLRREDEAERRQAEQQADIAEQERTERVQQARAGREADAAREARARQRRTWESQWVQEALDLLPSDAPPEMKLNVGRAVREELAHLSPSDSDDVTSNLVGALIQSALRPWERRKEVGKIIESAVEDLPALARSFRLPPPFDFPLTEWETLAKQEARRAIDALSQDCQVDEMRAAAARAVKRVEEQYEREKARKAHGELLDSVVACVDDDVKEVVRNALAKLPVGCGWAQMHAAGEEVLRPIREKAKLDEATKRKEQNAAFNAERHLWHVSEYIEEIGGEKGKYNLGDFYERCQFTERIKQKIRPQLVHSILRGELDEDEAREFIEEAVDREM